MFEQPEPQDSSEPLKANDAGIDIASLDIATVYAELRRLAHRNLIGNRWMSTLDTTSLVSESFIRLQSAAASHATERAHYFNLASRIMRQIICDYARKRMTRHKHIDPQADADEALEALQQEMSEAQQLVKLDEALKDLAQVNERYVKVIECRFFAGLTEEETAETLGVSLRTVERDWSNAKQWLAHHIAS